MGKKRVVAMANAAVSIDDVGRQRVHRLPLTPVQVDPKVLAAYAGKYQSSDGVILTIRIDGTRTFIQVPDRPEVELLARFEKSFTHERLMPMKPSLRSTRIPAAR